jgi:hypothetical protein
MTADDIPRTPREAVMLVVALQERRPPLDGNEWLMVAEVAEHLAAVSSDPAWSDVFVRAHASRLRGATGVHRTSEMVARARMIARFGVDEKHEALRPQVVIAWVEATLGTLDRAVAVAAARRLRTSNAVGDEAWLEGRRRTRQTKSVAAVAAILANYVALPDPLVAWANATTEL